MIFEFCPRKWLGICQAGKGKEGHDGMKGNSHKERKTYRSCSLVNRNNLIQLRSSLIQRMCVPQGVCQGQEKRAIIKK